MSAGAFIEIAGLWVTLGGEEILHDLTLSIREGDYVSIVGPNGAGKTTLIKCLGRIHRHWRGTIDVAGRALRSYGNKEFARLVSYVPQAEGQTFPFSVHDFVMLGRYPHLSPFTSVRREDHESIARALELTGLEAFRDRMMNTLSGGERQMAFIAAALTQGARILLLDEPATFLDYRHQAQVMALLHRINSESGITILSVNHNINSAALWSDRIVAIKNGRRVFEGTPAEIMAPSILPSIYDTPFEFVARPAHAIPLVVAEGAS